MTYKLESIAESDAIAYRLKEIDRRFFIGATRARYWVIDRERGIYLRNVANGGGAEPELRSRTFWTFSWCGELLTLRLDLVDAGGERYGTGWSRWLLVWVSGGEDMLAHLKPEAAQVVAELGVALAVHKGVGGVHSTCVEHVASIDVAKGCLM